MEVGHGGKTAYERTTGRRCTQEVVPIGEIVLSKAAKNSGDRKRVWRKLERSNLLGAKQRKQ